MSQLPKKNPVAVSIGLMVSNEEGMLPGALESLFRQSIFERLGQRREGCEIVVVAHACTDRTAAVARAFFEKATREHNWPDGCTAHVIELPEPGRANAWNRFVHEFSAVEARTLVSMDAEIAFHCCDSVFKLTTTLERRSRARAAVGRRCSELIFKERRTLRDRLSIANVALNGTDAAKLDAQLFCVRAGVARRLYLPRDVSAAHWGFLREMICTDGFTRGFDASRVALAPGAVYISATCTQSRDVLHQQERQMMGQTTLHVLVEYLKTRSSQERQNLAETLRAEEARDPEWLKKLIAAHLRRRRFFWQIFPRVLTSRLERLMRQPGLRKITRAPAALSGSVFALIACARASRALRAGLVSHELEESRPASTPIQVVGAKPL